MKFEVLVGIAAVVIIVSLLVHYKISTPIEADTAHAQDSPTYNYECHFAMRGVEKQDWISKDFKSKEEATSNHDRTKSGLTNAMKDKVVVDIADDLTVNGADLTWFSIENVKEKESGE